MFRTVTDTWKKYESGINFFRREKYMYDCAKAERFYANDHWYGMEDVDLPKPVMPISKRICDFKVSSIMSEDIKMSFSVDGYAEGMESENANLYKDAGELFTGYADTTCEEVKERALNEQMLLKAALTGAGIKHYYFDTKAKIGNDVQAIGRIKGEVINSTNLILGNPNDPRINDYDTPIQPYIIIPYRELVSKIKEQAKEKKIKDNLIKLISSDTDTSNFAFDKEKMELDDMSKTTALLHYFVKDDTIWMKKATKTVEFFPEVNTGMRIYPVTLMNWSTREGFAYGTGEMKGQIPNQIAVNQLLAQIILSAQRTGTPTYIYDRLRMSEPNNKVGRSVGVDGDINSAAKYLETGQVSQDMYLIVDKIVSMTKDLAGANENALGEAKADNTSALMWSQKQSSMPLESIKRRYYQVEEDTALIFAEFWKTKFNTTRAITIKNKEGKDEVRTFKGIDFKDVRMKLKIDIGASSQWSEITNLNMLNSWLQSDKITFIEYLERLPQGTVMKKQQLIDARQEQQNDKELLYKLMADYVQSLEPQVKAQLQQLLQSDPAAYEDQIKQLILGGEQNEM
ncbi:MAG: hypothetical protein AB9836_06015 [Aminipila sp.]